MKRVFELIKNNRLQALCMLYAVILASGVGTAIFLSDDPHWMGWSLSRLGETGVNRGSAFAFNFSVFISSWILAALGVLMAKSYARLGQIRSAKISAWLMILSAICMLGVALCPNDTLHAAHFAFSRGIIVLMVLVMLTLPASLNYLTQRERMFSFAVPIFSAILAAQGYALKSFWFVAVEVILGVIAAAWLFLACRDIDKRLT